MVARLPFLGKSVGLPDEEIEKMLEEDLPEDFKGAPKPKEKPYVTRQKTVLEGVFYFSILFPYRAIITFLFINQIKINEMSIVNLNQYKD